MLYISLYHFQGENVKYNRNIAFSCRVGYHITIASVCQGDCPLYANAENEVKVQDTPKREDLFKLALRNFDVEKINEFLKEFDVNQELIVEETEVADGYVCRYWVSQRPLDLVKGSAAITAWLRSLGVKLRAKLLPRKERVLMPKRQR